MWAVITLISISGPAQVKRSCPSDSLKQLLHFSCCTFHTLALFPLLFLSWAQKEALLFFLAVWHMCLHRAGTPQPSVSACLPSQLKHALHHEVHYVSSLHLECNEKVHKVSIEQTLFRILKQKYIYISFTLNSHFKNLTVTYFSAFHSMLKTISPEVCWVPPLSLSLLSPSHPTLSFPCFSFLISPSVKQELLHIYII